ncbi:WD40/YVTN/BNR-like repeat-containing protein [Flavihumibacter stibioxidans]|uniref:Glycosyl hydrolase n=1 Tax=Flavihumibacter stibioxidans TaxID=1834163 RepID=A0ABR7M6D3_9BACT|nr:glycosyl hydrolase [Flavihumibacter stibioxidans]MBC6490552.1 glycosyl hydrolase [Flavihumibacter stibioxidans]
MRKLLLVALLLPALGMVAQKKKQAPASAPAISTTDSLLFSQTGYRLIGPWRGGRSAAVAGSYKNRQTFYMGATGGGVWKTTDGGNNWKNISDKYFGGTMGAVAVAPSDENVIYVGEGENTMRGNVAEGLGGMWRSDDAGRTWRNIGLKDGRHIIRVVIHPRNPDIVWVAVMGHLFGPNEERGVYKTVDGGKTWKRTLFVNNQTGASDLVMEPGNPQVFYAGTWRLIRTPHSLESGGEGSGLWKSTDGGETWKNITAAKGLPSGVWGIVGVAVAPSNPDKVYAIMENANGGLYASQDAGKSWTLQSSDNNIRQRAWYYTKVFVDPKNENLVYAPNVGFMVSRDGGKTFQGVGTPHSDHHDLWIDPEDGRRMIVADDGGAQVSYDGGNSWSTMHNQPTSQIYRVSTDNSFPYRILGAQQDNSTFRIKHRTYGAAITDRDWEETAGSESGYVVADPLNPDIVYGGNYGGYLSRLDHRTGENRAISVWPDNPMGAGADVLKYRFQWNFPIFFSPHNPKRLYCAGNALFVTENEGASWEQISPDLTTNDKSKQGPSGGPITKDNTSVEYYCTIFTAAESALEKDLLWTGSDDGLVHISRDGGKNWDNVTPANAPKWIMWNAIETHPSKKGVAYITGTRYKLDDFTPYIYKTTDYGKSWTLITRGIDNRHFTRVMRADHKRDGLLYAGTEYGMYISYDDGANWRPFQLNLPVVPITDLTIKENDLIAATQGRAFWMIDDLTMVQQYDASLVNKRLHVYPVNDAWRMVSGGGRRRFRGAAPVNAGANPPSGVVINFLASGMPVADTSGASLTIFDKDKKLVKEFSTKSKENKLELEAGLNQFVWDLQYPAGERIDGMILWNGVPGSITAAPGNYFARIRVGKDSAEVPFVLKADPNYKITQSDYEAQFSFLREVQGKFNDVQKGIKDIRSLRTQLTDFVTRQGKDCPKEVKALADSIKKQLTSTEEALYQTKAKSFQDVLNFPIRLNDKLAGVFNTANSGNMAPSKQSREVYAELARQCDAELARLKKIRTEDLDTFNKLVREKSLPVIRVNGE